ncbi:MAG TPA: transporter [candidate division Zixibacteria bacterium]|nr:transporter [candidate division Zixibacteria bacterium]HBZ01565.1 transporter [candidate division Zixibacteria bacterium]
MTDLLAGNSLLLLFVVIGIGYLIGNLRIFGFSLGVAAVLFAGMAFGAVDSRLVLPEFIYVIGLVLFVYSIGLQAGPGFFASFRKRGMRTSILAILLLCGGAALAFILSGVMKLSGPATAGLFCGALTNTPALAATIESVSSLSSKLSPDKIELLKSAPVVAYGLAYPIGVFGVIFWFHIFARIFKINFTKEEASRVKQFEEAAILSKTYRIINPALGGQTVEKMLQSFGHTGFVLSRIKKGDSVEIVGPHTVLAVGDFIVAVGTERSQEIARILFGEEAESHIEERHNDMSYRRIFVSSKKVIGKTIEELRYEHPFTGAITRLRRGDVEFVPGPETILERGDRILVVSRRDRADEIAAIFGDSIKSISEADFLSLSLGIVIGVLVGMIPIPLGRGLTFKLGFAGGPLVVGLILGRLEKTGPIIWGMPFNANLALRQIGLVFFMAGIGTRAGTGFGATFQSGGLSIIFAGAILTTCVAVAAILLGYRYLKLPFSAVMGMMSGIQTQPACLAYANERANNEMPNTWYATVYPASMIAKIILAQVIVSTLLALGR